MHTPRRTANTARQVRMLVQGPPSTPRGVGNVIITNYPEVPVWANLKWTWVLHCIYIIYIY